VFDSSGRLVYANNDRGSLHLICMGIVFPFLGWFFSWGSLGVIGLMVFTFIATTAGFIGGLIAFLLTGRKNYDIWRAWWILTTGGLIVWGLIRLISMF